MRPLQQSFGQVQAFSTSNGFIGFHQERLEVAELSAELFDDLSLTSAWSELKRESPQGSSRPALQSVTINVTQICNLHCTYCAAGGDGTYGQPQRRMAVEKVLPGLTRALHNLEAGDEFRVSFIGGEPLLYPEGIRWVVDHVRSTRPDVHTSFVVITNGTLFSESVVELLASLKIEVKLSLDGPPEINDRSRPQKNGRGITAEVVSGLQRLLARRSELEAVTVSAVFGKHNVDAEKTYDFLSQFQFDQYGFSIDLNANDSALLHSFLLSVEKLARRLASHSEAELLKLRFFSDLFDQLDARAFLNDHCGGGTKHLAVDTQGQTSGCHWWLGKSKKALGSFEAFSPEKAISDIESRNCQACWARGICGGGCAFAHEPFANTLDKKNPLFCLQQRYLIQLGIELYARFRR